MQISASSIISATALARRGRVSPMSPTLHQTRTAFAGQPDPPLGMTNIPTGYPSSLRLLEKFKKAYPLHRFVTHGISGSMRWTRPMAQASISTLA